MKLQQRKDKGLKANFFSDVSQDVSQLNITVIHRRERDTGSAGGSVNLQRVLFSQRLKDGRYRADDPGRGLPGIGYFQTDALAAKKTAQLVPSYVLSSPRYSKASVTRFIEKAQRAAISQALMREAKLGQS